MSGCKVTDRGMRLLCIEENGSVGCSLIEHVSILATDVTSSGFKMIVRMQRKLRTIYWEDSIAALSELRDELSSNAYTRDFPLSQLALVKVQGNACIRHIHNAHTLCRHLAITKLEFAFPSSLTDDDLNYIGARLNLKELLFTCSRESLVTFPHGIVPFLEKHCRGLLTLYILEMKDVDVRSIATLCPNLNKLQLLFNDSYTRNGCPDSLNHLEKFEFSADDSLDDVEFTLSENQLSSILASPKLKSVKINKCITLTVLATAFGGKNCENLSFIDISYCHSVTSSGLRVFKTEENAISYFAVRSCKRINTRRLENEWKLAAREKNWKIQMYFLSEIVVMVGNVMQGN